MLASASGELKTRSEPNSRCRPAGELEDSTLAFELLVFQILVVGAVGHIFAKDDDALVVLHLIAQAFVDEVGHGAVSTFGEPERKSKRCRGGLEMSSE